MLRIKLFRMHKGLSQWELSRDAGFSQGRYSMIERGLVEPTHYERARIAKLLGIKASTLFRPAVLSNERRSDATQPDQSPSAIKRREVEPSE